MPDKSWLRPTSYSQWVGSALKLVRAEGGRPISLFESSVPEPRELLRQTIVEGVEPQFGKRFVSAFFGGNPFILDGLCDRYGIDRRQVLGTSGATTGVSLIYRTFAGPGDHILVETPGFDLFADVAADLGIEWETFQRKGECFQFDVAEIEAKLRANTKLVVVSNLHNPSGMVIEHARLEELAALAERRGFLVVVDEVYGDYADHSERPVPAFAISPNVISVSSLTKIFGLGGLRCGWIIAAPELMDRVRELAMRVDFNVSSLSHAVGAYVFEKWDVFEAYSRGVLAQSRPIFEQWFDQASKEGLLEGRVPDAGCIAFPRLTGIGNTQEFCEWLLRRSGVVVAPGEAFGAPGHVRIGFAMDPESLRRGLDLLAEGAREFRVSGIEAMELRETRG